MGKFSGHGTAISDQQVHDFQCMPGYVLLKPMRSFLDNVFETSSGLLINTTFSTSENAILQAKVIAVCDELGYQEESTIRPGAQTIGAKIEFDVDIEVQKGDTVMCRYLAIHNAVKEYKILVSEDGEDFYVLVSHDSLIVAERGDEIIPLNGYYLIREYTQMVKKYATERGMHTEVPTQGVIVHVPQSPVDRYWWEEIKTKRMTKCGMRPRLSPAYVDTMGVYHPQEITGFDPIAGNAVEGSYPYRDHGYFVEDDRIVFKRNVAPTLDNEVAPAVRRNSFKGLRRIHEKDISGYVIDGKVVPNKMRILLQPDKTSDYYQRLQKGVPENKRKLPWSGLVTSIWKDQEDYLFGNEFLRRKVQFMRKPEHIFKQGKYTQFIINLNTLV